LVAAAFQIGVAYFTMQMDMAEYQLRVVIRNDVDLGRLKIAPSVVGVPYRSKPAADTNQGGWFPS
jgi:hypothetical protein